MKQHEMKLATEPFKAIREGKKIIESRLFDEKRQEIELGDEIVFVNRDNSEQLNTRVEALFRYPTFSDMFNDQEPSRFGGPDAEWLLNQIAEFYPLDEQYKYGVLGIKFELIAA